MLKNITLSAEESLIREARSLAAAQNTTLNAMFREWLVELVEEASDDDQNRIANAYDEMMERLSYVNAGRRFTREELNERG